MRNQRGQATILVGIIFQFVFIFFAMVINVGLLINDKINLQNSVDVAAYYGAMKQAEVMNTMAHVNYQIRQVWKLFNWRLWALGDIGRTHIYLHSSETNIQDFVSQMVATAENQPAYDNTQPTYPVVCVRNPFWAEEHSGSTTQNFCKSTSFNIPALKPLVLGAFQSLPLFSFLNSFQNTSMQNAASFSDDCLLGADRNLYFATTLLASFKTAAVNRRIVMRNLEKLLVKSTSDFQDISGSSVSATTQNVFNKNLTLANRQSVQNFNFYNSVGNSPFLVPIDVIPRMTYVDIFPIPGSCSGTVKELDGTTVNAPGNPAASSYYQAASSLLTPDYFATAEDAGAFLAESDSDAQNKPRSLVGFEKNPYVMAYVRVRASTRPKMLFSPIGVQTITLSAEAYASPFGGKMGPWYSKTWAPGQPTSDKNTAPGQKPDSLLPPRVGDSYANIPMANFAPNYSKYPGDMLGMQSAAAKVQGMSALGNNPQGSIHLFGSDYGQIFTNFNNANNSGAGSNGQLIKIDAVVGDSSAAPTGLRAAELIAIAPDIFDSLYYSIGDNFGPDVQNYSNQNFYSNLCPVGCEDLGNGVPYLSSNVGYIVGGLKSNNYANSQIGLSQMSSQNSFWKLTSPDHLKTSWGQYRADSYTPQDYPKFIAKPAADGGRSGYSVKIVSEKFLTQPITNLGGNGVTGTIINLPQ